MPFHFLLVCLFSFLSAVFTVSFRNKFSITQRKDFHNCITLAPHTVQIMSAISGWAIATIRRDATYNTERKRKPLLVSTLSGVRYLGISTRSRCVLVPWWKAYPCERAPRLDVERAIPRTDRRPRHGAATAPTLHRPPPGNGQEDRIQMPDPVAVWYDSSTRKPGACRRIEWYRIKVEYMKV